jgi:hypothetical protein
MTNQDSNMIQEIDGITIEADSIFKWDYRYDRYEASINMRSELHSSQCHSYFKDKGTGEITISMGLQSFVGHHVIAANRFTVDGEGMIKEYDIFAALRNQTVAKIIEFLSLCITSSVPT